MVLRAVSELRRERVRRHGGGPLQEAGGRAPCRQADAPGLRRGAPAVRPPAEDLRGHHEPRRLRALRPEGLHPVPNLRGGGRLQEAERGEVRSVYGVDFRVVSDAEAEHSRLELLPAAVLEEDHSRWYCDDQPRLRAEQKEAVPQQRRVKTDTVVTKERVEKILIPVSSA